MAAGVRSLGMPVYGYYFLISRGIAYAATWLPVVWAPYAYAWAAAAVNVMAAGYFSRPGFAWLVPDRRLRILACVVLAMGPGTSEVFANLCNLPSALTFLGLLLLLEKPFAPSATKTAALVLLFLSAGPMVLLVPLVGALLWFTRNRRYLVLLCCLIPVTVLNTMGNHVQSEAAGYRNYGALAHIPLIVTAHTLVRVVVAPFVGPFATEALMRAHAALFWTTLGMSVAVGIWAVSRFEASREKLTLLVSSYLLVCGTFAIIALSRSYALSQLLPQSVAFRWGHRYSYLPGAVAILLWFSIVSGTPVRRGARAVCAAVLLLITFHNVLLASFPLPRPDLHWPRTAATIQRALDLRRTGRLDAPVRIEGIEAHPHTYKYRLFAITISP